jgi:hypothetical protein
MLSKLEVLFSSAARVQVLGLFLRNADRQFYQREIERETGQPIRAVQREVKRLAEIGLLSHSTEGNRIFYRLDPNFPLLAPLTALFQRAGGVEGTEGTAEAEAARPPEPWTVDQPFEWLETLYVPPVLPRLRHLQMEGEWDRAY